MTNSAPNVLVAGRTSYDVKPRSSTRVELQFDGVTLTNPSCCTKFIPTRQKPAPGSKIDAAVPLDELVGNPLVEKPQPAGGALNAIRGTASLASNHNASVTLSLVVENAESPGVAELGDCEGFRVGFGNLSSIPVNLCFEHSGDRTIVKTPLSQSDSCRTLGHFAHLVPMLRAASVVALVSPASPLMVAALMAMSNGAMKIAQPTGALNLAMTVLMLREMHDLVVSFDDLLTLSASTGFSLEDAGTETSSQAVETVLRTLRFLRSLQLSGSVAALVSLGKRGCIVADWRRDKIEHIDLELFKEVATRNGAGDTFLGAWVFYRALGHDPLEAALKATEQVVEWHGLKTGEYRIRLDSL